MSDASELAALRRQAERLIAAAASAASAPLVIWQRMDEPLHAFDRRCESLRAARPQAEAILAVQSGRRTDSPPAGVKAVELPSKCFAVLHPTVKTRYRYLDGGRASAKSTSVATVLILRALTDRIRVLCCREIQKSIRESVHRLLSDRIDALALTRYFDVREHSISSASGAEVLFEGLFANVTKIKSLEGLSFVWIEQAESVSHRSLEVLIPTVRAPGSEIWFTSNPDDPLAPIETYRERADTRYVHVTFDDNPWFPDVLRPEMAYLQRVDDDAYKHVWLGVHRVASDAQVFRGKYAVEDFAAAPGWDGPYYGADWGFSQDPTTLVRCWIAGRTLYVDYEAYAVGVDIDLTPALFDLVPDARRHTIRADSARPETISYLRRNGYPDIVGVEKWTGSVEDGIAHLRQYERIVVHPRCTHTADEMRLYSYKTDRLTGDVLPDVIDKHNHIIDALRYALAPLISVHGPYALLEFYRSQMTGTAPASARADRTGAVVTPLGGST